MKIYKKAQLLYTWAFTNTKTTAAIDITNSCNLKCSHCYWWKEERPAELGDDAMVAFMKGLRAMGMTAAIIYGGEPMLRPRMCEAASRIFDHTLSSPMERRASLQSMLSGFCPSMEPGKSTTA